MEPAISMALARAPPKLIVAARNGMDDTTEQGGRLTWGSAREAVATWWVIDPLKVSWPAYWDLAATMALLYTAIVTPVEVAFVQAPTGDNVFNAMFWANRAIDIIFLIDMALQFRLAVRVTGAEGTRWLHTPKDIAKAYVSSKWFWLDLFSIMTSLFDFPIFGTEEAVKNLVALRAVRVLRLAKLIRLARGSRILKRWEMRVSINYSYLSLANVMVIIVLGCHWVACVWGLQASFNPLNSWLSYVHVKDGDMAYCVSWAEGVDEVTGQQMMKDPAACPKGPGGAARHCNVGICTSGVCTGGYNLAHWSDLYVMALFFAICSVSGVGSMIATPYNMLEQSVAGLVHLATGMLWAYLIGVFTSLASNFSPTVQAFRDDLSRLNSFMSANNLPRETRYRLREYLHETVHMRNTEQHAALLTKLPPAMQDEVAWFVNEAVLRRVWYLNWVSTSSTMLLTKLAAGLTPLVFTPGEYCPPGFLYFIKRGQVLWASKVLHEGDVWGDDVILNRPHLQLRFPALAISYVWVLYIDGQTIVDTIEKFPKEAAYLFHVRQWWIARRALVREAERRCHAQGVQFRGRPRPIYASEISKQLDAAAANRELWDAALSTAVPRRTMLRKSQERADRDPEAEGDESKWDVVRDAVADETESKNQRKTTYGRFASRVRTTTVDTTDESIRASKQEGKQKRSEFKPLLHYLDVRTNQMAQKSTEGDGVDERLMRIEGRLEQMDRLERKLDLLLSKPAPSPLHLPQVVSGTGIGTRGQEPASASDELQPAARKLQSRERAGSQSKERTGWLGGVIEVLTPKSANAPKSADESASHREPLDA